MRKIYETTKGYIGDIFRSPHIMGIATGVSLSLMSASLIRENYVEAMTEFAASIFFNHYSLKEERELKQGKNLEKLTSESDEEFLELEETESEEFLEMPEFPDESKNLNIL